MNRLQKKCLIVSSALHVLLLGIILFGAALMPQKQAPPVKLLTMVDLSRLTDSASTPGGAPGGTPPSPEPPKPEVTPPAPPPAVPQPVSVPKPPEVKVPQPKPPTPIKKTEPPKDAPPAKDEFTPVKRTTPKPPIRNTDNDQAEADAKRLADNQKRIAVALNTGAKNLNNNLNPGANVDLRPGDGGEGASNYRDAVYTIYYNAWVQPTSLTDGNVKVLASVTISRDGLVKAHHITKSSGNPVMDKSVQNALDGVNFIAPFPAGSRDPERTFILEFKPETKGGMG
jgi:TonB family protein